MAAQRYPEDFDGIIAGAPANNQTQLCAWRIAVEAKILQEPASVVSRTKLALVNRAVLAACDALDGVTDGLLTDPHQCRFDPASLLCRGVDMDDCLTAPQVEAVKMGYAPARRKTGELIYPGLVPGGEMGWAMLTGANPEPGGIDVGMFRYVAHEDPAWDWRTFDLDRDTSLIDKKAGFIDAVNPDLSAFRARGGKLLIYHGWNDGGSGGAISPQNSVNYYSSVLARMGPQQEDWLRLFMVPGMAHCGGGPGPNQVNWMAALERWRESGIAPDRLIASRVSDNRVNMTRPVCPYPQVAQYTGVGSTNDAANFVCKVIDKKAGFIDAVNADLSGFRARGGKLLIYHGWNDGGSGGAISPQNSVNYYSSVLAQDGAEARGLAATLHGARYGALRGWAGPEPGELDGRDGALARIRNRT